MNDFPKYNYKYCKDFQIGDQLISLEFYQEKTEWRIIELTRRIGDTYFDTKVLSSSYSLPRLPKVITYDVVTLRQSFYKIIPWNYNNLWNKLNV